MLGAACKTNRIQNPSSSRRERLHIPKGGELDGLFGRSSGALESESAIFDESSTSASPGLPAQWSRFVRDFLRALMSQVLWGAVLSTNEPASANHRSRHSARRTHQEVWLSRQNPFLLLSGICWGSGRLGRPSAPNALNVIGIHNPPASIPRWHTLPQYNTATP